jgi:hypothetical protein
MADDTVYLSRSEAADYCKSRGFPCAKNTLTKLASTGGGPAFKKFGPSRNSRVLYTREGLDAWITSQLSASQTGAVAVA